MPQLDQRNLYRPARFCHDWVVILVFTKFQRTILSCVSFGSTSPCVLVIILVLGVGFAALRGSLSALWGSGIFTVTLGILLLSILLAVHRSESKRAFWLGFALFGWAYTRGLTLMPSIESRLITTSVLAYLLT